MIPVCFQGKPFNITVIQAYAPTTNAEEAEVKQFYEDLEDLLELIPKRCPFHHSVLECKSRKLRDTWSNRQVWPWSTRWSKTKASRVLPREHTGHSKTFSQQHNTKIRLTMFFAAKDGEALYSQQKQNLELTVAQIMSSLLQNSGLNWRK